MNVWEGLMNLWEGLKKKAAALEWRGGLEIPARRMAGRRQVSSRS